MKKIWLLIITIYVASAQALPLIVRDTFGDSFMLDSNEYFSKKSWKTIIDEAAGNPIKITMLMEIGHPNKYYFLTEPLNNYDTEIEHRSFIPGTKLRRNISTTKRYRLIPAFPRPYLTND
ncbi:hypothetical protein A3F06_02700 [candidate division TM6 bacterium RIFCSPHIGHO2_12_FULL_36_22]|nr:MAG: hypothetical protein A3F06_02700 [candidate division TM6 bacterium RIFCSPHIGHO2_12_FULL_36_22]